MGKLRELDRLEEGRRETVIKEVPCEGGKLILVESAYRNFDGNVTIAEAVTFIPEKGKVEPVKKPQATAKK